LALINEREEPMRSVIASGIALISLAFLMFLAPSAVVAAEACQ